MRALVFILASTALFACGSDAQNSVEDGGSIDATAIADATVDIDGMIDAAPLEFTIDTSVRDWHNPSIEASIHFSPNPDLEEKLLAELGAADTSIHMAFFNIRLNSFRDLLIAKNNAGLDVHVLLDAKQQALVYNTMAAELSAAGVTVTEITNASAQSAVMNNRFTILDNEIVITGSAPFNTTAFNINDEDIAIVRNSDLASRYETEFQELIAGTEADSLAYANGTAVRAYMGPEDNLYQKVVDVVDGAQSQVLVAMHALNTNTVVTSLINAHNRGVNVIVVLDAVQAGQNGETADETLIAAGVPVILATTSGTPLPKMHSRFVVVDHETVVMGSFVGTNLASFFNDENILLIDDAALAVRVEGKFATLIDQYSGQTALALGLTTGGQMITFSVSNVTLDAGLTVKIRSFNGGPFDSPLDLNNFSITESIPSGASFEYLYEVHGPMGMLYSEDTTRRFTVPYAPGPFSLTEALSL